MAVSNALLVRWRDGYHWVEDAASIDTWGRKEGFLSLGSVASVDEAVRIAQAVLETTSAPQVSLTANVEPTGINDSPYVDFSVGDMVTAPDMDEALTEFRVVSLSVTEDEEGNPKFTPELGTHNDDRERIVQRWLKRMSNGTLGGSVESAAPILPLPPEALRPAPDDITPFSFGGLLFPATSSPYSPATPVRVVSVTSSLTTAGTSTTTYRVLRSGVIVATITLASGVTKQTDPLLITVYPTDSLVVDLITPGTGAAGLSVQMHRAGLAMGT